LTLANENLRAERANNAEFGATFRKKSSFIRAVLFLTLVDDPVANVTLSATTSLITRQRQNVGQTISRGTELEAERHFKKLSVSGSYFLADSEIRKFPGNPALEGLKVPQVAHHQFTAQASYTQQRWVIALQGRGSSSQFDDDLNLFRLEPYAQLDVFVSRGLGDRVKIYGAVENILNLRYSIGKTPARTVSSPINVRLGLRFK